MVQPTLKVLIVDDSEVDREIYIRYLRGSSDYSFVPIEADIGEEGLLLAQQADLDVILLDYLLPDIDGLDFLHTLKANMNGSMPPLIVVTGQGNETIAAKTIKAGAEDYLVKGQITPTLLQHSIEQAVEKSILRQQLKQSEEHLRLALEAAAMGTWAWHFPKRQLYCSSQVNDIFGLAADTAITEYETLFEQVHPEDRGLVEQSIRQAIDQGIHCNVDFRLVQTDGSIRWLNGKGQFYPETETRSARMLGTVSDISRSKQAEIERYQVLESERIVANIIRSVRRSLDIDQVLETAVAEVRQLLQADRVVIFQLLAEDEGTVVAESVDSAYASIVRSSFHDSCLPRCDFERYDQGGARSVNDIHAADLTPCYVSFLESLQVRASITVPIRQGETFWGLLVVHHCSAPRQWQSLETRLLQQLADQLGSVFRQAELYRRVQLELQERRRTEAELKESEARLRQAVTEAPFPIFIHAEDGTILQISRAVVEITGYTRSELKTLNDWTVRAYGKHHDTVMQDIARLYRINRRVDEGEFKVRTRSGETRTWLFSSAPLGRRNNGKRLIISMAADITQRKQAQASLASRLGQQAAVTQLSRLALSGMDLDTLFDQATQIIASKLEVELCKVLELLPNGADLLLRSGVGWREGLVGRATVGSDFSSQAGYTLQSHQPVVVNDLRTETRFSGPALLRDHGVVSGMSTTIKGVGDRPFGVIGIHSTRDRQFTDDDVNFLQSIANILSAAIGRKHQERVMHQLNLSLEHRVEERTRNLKALNQELEAFSYSVAHDVRAPLRAIQGFAQLFREDYQDALDELGLEYIHRIETAAEHLDTLVLDLLEYSRLNRVDIRLKRVSVADAVKSVLASLNPNEDSSAQIELAPDLPFIWAQPSLLKQVLSNLIENAIKFVAPGVQPQIVIWSETREYGSDPTGDRSRWARIWIQDNGIGIAAHHQERIFNTLERLHGIETYPGTGIGLAIVKRSIEKMGGRVGVESAINQGSRFWIELKLAK